MFEKSTQQKHLRRRGKGRRRKGDHPHSYLTKEIGKRKRSTSWTLFAFKKIVPTGSLRDSPKNYDFLSRRKVKKGTYDTNPWR